MLQTLRKHSSGIFAKVLLGLIAVVFVFWGIGDIFHSYTRMKPVVTVGGNSISQEEFLDSYSQMKRYFQVVTKGKLSPDELKAMKLEKKVLENLIEKAALDNELHHLGLVVSHNMVRQYVQAFPDFQNKQGTFDPNRFRAFLEETGQSEPALLHSIKLNLEKQQLFVPLSSSLKLPKSYIENLYKIVKQKYVFDVAYIPLASIEVTQAPSDTELEQVYKQNQELFTRPEYRDVDVLVADPIKMQAALKISNEQLREEYQRRMADFIIPETRDVVQLVFATQEEAEKALKLLREGEHVEKVSKEKARESKHFEAANRDRFTAEQAKVIFEMKTPGATDVQRSMLFGWTIFVVTKINPEYQQSLETVRPTLEKDLRAQTISNGIDELRNRIEDELAGGEKFANVAQHHQLELIKIGAIDKQGHNSEGKIAIPDELSSLVLEQAFTLEEGSDSPVLDGPEGKMVVIHINSITPKSLPPLTDIRDKVVAHWRQIKQQEGAAKLALDITKEVTSPALLKDLAKKNSLVIRTLDPMSLSDLEQGQFKDENIGTRVLRRGFKLPPNRAGYAPAKDGFGVIMINKVVPFDANENKEEWTKFQEAMKGLMQKDFQSTYIKALKDKEKIDINDQILSSLTGQES